MYLICNLQLDNVSCETTVLAVIILTLFTKFSLFLKSYCANILKISTLFSKSLSFFTKFQLQTPVKNEKSLYYFFFLVALILLGMLEVQHGDVSSIKFQSCWKGQFPVSRSEQQLHQLQFSGRIPNQHSGRNIVAITIWYLCVEVSSSAPVAFKGTCCITHINNKEKKKRLYTKQYLFNLHTKKPKVHLFSRKKGKKN